MDQRATGDWWPRAARRPSPNVDRRPDGMPVTLALIHSISLPPGEYGGDAVEQLFDNRLDWDAHPSFADIRGLRVSAHVFIRRDGSALQFAAFGDRAWHAGVSSWQGRPRCNDYAVGIELEGLEGGAFEDAQYACLADLVQWLLHHHPISAVVGHEHVAPGRKLDPGAGFDWQGLRTALGASRRAFALDMPSCAADTSHSASGRVSPHI